MKPFDKPLFPIIHFYDNDNKETKFLFKARAYCGDDFPCIDGYRDDKICALKIFFIKKHPLLHQGILLKYRDEYFTIQGITTVKDMPDLYLCYARWLYHLS